MYCQIFNLTSQTLTFFICNVAVYLKFLAIQFKLYAVLFTSFGFIRDYVITIFEKLSWLSSQVNYLVSETVAF